MAISWQAFSPQSTQSRIGSPQRKRGRIPMQPQFVRYICRTAPIALAQRATCSILAPSFIGSCGTSLRQAPKVTAAMTAASTIARFIAFSFSVSLRAVLLTHYLSNRQIGASAQLQGFSTNLTATSRKGHGGHNRRDYDHVLDVHVFSPKLRQTHRRGYSPGTLRSSTQLLFQGFCTSVDAQMPRSMTCISSPKTPILGHVQAHRCIWAALACPQQHTISVKAA